MVFRHHLIHASLANVAETLAVVLAVVHQFRPSFLHLYRAPQQYYQQQRHHGAVQVSLATGRSVAGAGSWRYKRCMTGSSGTD